MFMYMYVKSCFHVYTGLNLSWIGKFYVVFATRKLSIHVAPVGRVYVTDLHVYKYYYRKCSSELADLVPPKRVTVRSTRFSEQMHRHTLSLPKCRTGYYTSSFFPRTATIWNSLSNECFPTDYDLTAFKGRVNKFLLQQ